MNREVHSDWISRTAAAPVKRPNYPPEPECYRLRLLLAWGKEAEAEALLEAINRFNTAFGGEPWTMPLPLSGPREGLLVADASKVTPAEFLAAVRGRMG